MLAVTAIALMATPVALGALALADLMRRRPNLPSVRVYLVALQYLLNDTVEILVAPVLWIVAGFGTNLQRPSSVARHEQLQRWSLCTLYRRAHHLLGVRVTVDGGDLLAPGPVIVLGRHVHAADAALPAYLYLAERHWHVRGVMMAELLADPGFDLIYQRTGHVFIDRANPDAARGLIRQTARHRDGRTAFVVFPEGRLYRPAWRDYYLDRLTQKQPQRAQRLQNLRHVLPPRPNGFLELLHAVPEADVVVLAHTGLEHIPHLGQLLRRDLPTSIPIRVNIRRYLRHTIPSDPTQQIEWLDTAWQQLDDTLEHMLSGQPTMRPSVPPSQHSIGSPASSARHRARRRRF
jgi:1-acyl-sn-glycerol-3-phosphate acyltransferase